MPVLVLLLIVFAVPLVNSFIMAFQQYKLGSADIHFNGLDNFRKLFSDENLGLILKNTMIYVFCSVAGQFLLGMALALALWKKFRGRGIYQSIVSAVGILGFCSRFNVSVVVQRRVWGSQ